MDNDNLTKLEQRIDELISACRRLSEENHTLKAGQRNLSEEHARLVEKTQVARTRIESMIGRLKALERA
ncbi:MAG: TIGR02449 family protein [Candidatus Muproteobacteria bacterium RBG_19FT_COMBO_61_10]|jgi:cell division protein ZapB|uniref:TIGR02449 family protein n=1 Tax=Candidatus Muproteobacteria bacterium RBG_19FT_COMBO_61_10 TaxID=1817761 RepID=A0A1F6UMY5_9PROT|nr:MAG: TIGR02449 family protein [Candidatus Muproteobacteria bacterium RBG_19FT_COMBO_61_10]